MFFWFVETKSGIHRKDFTVCSIKQNGKNQYLLCPSPEILKEDKISKHNKDMLVIGFNWKEEWQNNLVILLSGLLTCVWLVGDLFPFFRYKILVGWKFKDVVHVNIEE